MPILTLVRLSSIAFVWAALVLLPSPVFKAAFLALLFGHYALSAGYASPQARSLIARKSAWPPLAVLGLAGAAFIGSGLYVPALVPFIGLHIALSEVYMINLATGEDHWHLNLSRFLTNLSLFVLLLRGYPAFSPMPVIWIYAMVAASFAYFLAALRQGTGLPRAVRTDYLLFESSGLAIGFFLIWRGTELSQQMFVMYHVATWLMFPVIGFVRRGREEGLRWFAALVAVSTALFAVVGKVVDLAAAVPLWATLHFLTTLPLSRLNPRFVTVLFYAEESDRQSADTGRT